MQLDDEFSAGDELQEHMRSRPRIGDRSAPKRPNSPEESGNRDSKAKLKAQHRVVQEADEQHGEFDSLSAEPFEGDSLEILGVYNPDQRLAPNERAAVEVLHWQGGTDLTDPGVNVDNMVQRFNESNRDFEIFQGQYGYSLRTQKDIPMMGTVGIYSGIELPEHVVDNLPAKYNKCVESYRKGYSIVGDVIPRGGQLNYCAYANDPGFGIDKKRLPGNVALRSGGNSHRGTGFVFMQATRDIRAGEEILFNYGPNYWLDQPEFYPDMEQFEADRIRAEKRRK